MKGFLKLLLFVIIFALFGVGVVYGFMASLKFLRDKESTVDVDEGKYILLRLLERNEEILNRKNLELQKERELLLQQKDTIVNDTAREEIERKLKEIEDKQKNIKDEFQKNENEKKNYESALNNIKNELEQKKLEVARLSKEKLELQLELENQKKINDELRNNNKLIAENEELNKKLNDYEKQIAEIKEYWEKYILNIKNFLIENNEKQDNRINKGFTEDNGRKFITEEYTTLYNTTNNSLKEIGILKERIKKLEKIKDQSKEVTDLQEEIRNLTQKIKNLESYWSNYVYSLKNVLSENNLEKSEDIDKGFMTDNGKNTIIEEFNFLYKQLGDTRKYSDENRSELDKLNEENRMLKIEIANLTEKISQLESRDIVEVYEDQDKINELIKYWDDYVSKIKTAIINNYLDEEKKATIVESFKTDNGNNFITNELNMLYSDIKKTKNEFEILKQDSEKEIRFGNNKAKTLFKISNSNGFFIEKEGERDLALIINEDKSDEIINKGTFMLYNSLNGKRYSRIEIQKMSNGNYKYIKLPGFSAPKSGDWF